MTVLMEFIKIQSRQLEVSNKLIERMSQNALSLAAIAPPPGLAAASAAETVPGGIGDEEADVQMSTNKEVLLGKAVGAAAGKIKSRPESKAAINSACAELKEKLHNFHNSTANLKKLNDTASAFKEGRTPAGVKPHRLPMTTSFYDEEFVPRMAEKLVISFTVDPGTSAADAREQLYHHMQAQLFTIDAWVEEERLASLRENTSLKAFASAVEAKYTERNSKLAQHLKGLDAPEALAERGPGSLYDDLVGAYNECITAAAEARAKADYLKQKDLDRETKAKEKVANLAPADAMKKLVSEAVADQFKKAKGIQKRSVPRRRPGAESTTKEEAEKQGPEQEPKQGPTAQRKGQRQRQRKEPEPEQQRQEQGQRQRRQQRQREWRQLQRSRQVERRHRSQPTLRMELGALRYLFAGLSWNDFGWLAKPLELYDNIYTVLENPLLAVSLEPGHIPWPVALLLGSYSRRHVFLRPCALRMTTAGTAIRNFGNRVNWKWFFENVEVGPTLPVKRLIPRAPLSFGGTAAAEINWFTSEVRKCVEDHFKRANKWVSRHKHTSVMVPSFVRWSLTWIRNRQLRAVLSDKDGVFVLV